MTATAAYPMYANLLASRRPMPPLTHLIQVLVCRLVASHVVRPVLPCEIRFSLYQDCSGLIIIAAQSPPPD